MPNITAAQAQALTAAFIADHSQETVRGFQYSKDEVLAILDQEGATGLRANLGDDGAGKTVTYLIGVDEHGNNMRNGPITTSHKECPPICGNGD